jgi:hypothetical protein
MPLSALSAQQKARKASRDAKAVRGEMHNVLALMRRFDRTFQIPPQSSAILKSFKILHDHMQSVSSLDAMPTATYLKPFLAAVADCVADEDGGCSAHSGGTEYYTAMEIAVHALASVNKFVLYDIINPESRGVSMAMQRIAETISCCVLCPSEADETDKKEKKLILLFKLLELTVCCLRSEVRWRKAEDRWLSSVVVVLVVVVVVVVVVLVVVAVVVVVVVVVAAQTNIATSRPAHTQL